MLDSDRPVATRPRTRVLVAVRRATLRNFRPVTSFSERKTATELGREVSACQS